MNSRLLSAKETEQLQALLKVASDYALIFLTRTGLDKSILDATTPIRVLLRRFRIHDYDQQDQGLDFKKVLRFYFLAQEQVHDITTSLYRPTTKEGDPRIWFSGLPKLAEADDVIVLFISDGTPFLANLTELARSSEPITSNSCWLGRWLAERQEEASGTARELLTLLRGIASKGPIAASCSGDTAVGRAIETALGIQINSRREPDFRGIEIKTKRLTSPQTRSTLFAQVPNWSLSDCKSSAEILNQFGYHRDGDFKLYCSISTLRHNSQGLRFRLTPNMEQLIEYSMDFPRIAVWELQKLHERLLEKHPETFWIEVGSEVVSGKEYFSLEKVTHTRRPSIARFDEFLEHGIITMDHLIKYTGSKVSEKGPLFKIRPDRLSELFLTDAFIYHLT